MTKQVYISGFGMVDAPPEFKKPSYDSLASVRNDYETQLAQIRNNDMLLDKVKTRKIAELKTSMRDVWFETKKAVEAGEEAQLRAAWKAANPAPNVADMSAGEIQARREVLNEIERLQDNGDAILDLYARYYAQGYDIGMNALYEHGRKYLNSEQVSELQQMQDYINPGLADARKNYQAVKAQQGSDGQGRALMEGTFMQITQLDAGEADALAAN